MNAIFFINPSLSDSLISVVHAFSAIVILMERSDCLS